VVADVLFMQHCVILIDLGMEDGHQVVVADVTSPKPVTLTMKYIYNME
jgi:hypothetical protein